jgi:MFS superfamily sulfate permease-like transporter
MLGHVPRGLPAPGLPAVYWHDLNELLPLALACFLLATVETAAIGRMFAGKHGYRIDTNQELLAIAGANLAAGLGRGFPVSGGMSQSLVNESGGARTPLSGLVAALILLVVTLFFSGLLANLPQPVLAAIVLVAVTSLFRLSALRRLWRLHRGEFVVAMVAMFGVLGSGLLCGVMLGAIISLVLLIRRASRPNVAFLGRIPGTRRFSDLDRHPDNERIPGVLIFRVESSILYFNVDHVWDSVWARVREAAKPPRLVLCDLSNSPHVDLGGAEMLGNMHRDLAAAGIAFHLVEAHAGVRDLLRIEGLEEKVGRLDRFRTVADAVEDDLARGTAGDPAAPAPPPRP